MDVDIVEDEVEVEVEVPEYFICPISLEIMKDPVTAITGITYDRENIERWLFDTTGTTTVTPHCPVTNRPLPQDSDLTPNHTLRRLIQLWCTQNASRGIDRIPTPRAPLDRFRALNQLIKDLRNPNNNIPDRLTDTLHRMESLATKNEQNRKHMVKAGTPEAMLLYVVACFGSSRTAGLREALSILNLVQIPPDEARALLLANDRIIDSLSWVLEHGTENCDKSVIRSHALSVLKRLVDAANSSMLECLKPDIFGVILSTIRDFRKCLAMQGLNAALHILLSSCQWGRNRLTMVARGAVFELIELELTMPENRTTELILGILFHLCSYAEGRAQLISHKGGIAVISKRILHVSPSADDRAIMILSLVSKFSGTPLVVQEMLMVGAVSKLCMVIQSQCAPYLKNKAREILRSHSEEWKIYPCIKKSHLTRYFIE
ncbi:E3 ubiquitin-protein ligase PUB24-like [Punica granatum]|uniref:U-box domain-containing protein n=2 Tax=Punica granatum TaxID=22663 RepID=A0A218XD06_PUNGR|nr:E3 ubiquitin-protein ligase PUB24-like [Punica granatum]OWM82586.1 hypothetical protein CDL15_Pgr002161 [Punica granatum]PKI35314.1 hypothetical protein CRG98_044328 [Punica granatum]